MLAELKVKDFLSELESSAPVPGGGSVAALSAAIAASLTGMVANLTIGKKNYEDVQGEMETIAKSITAFRIKFTDYIDKDATSFDGVMKAFKLPKGTDEEKAIRSAAIQTGYKEAADVPLEVAKEAFGIFSMIDAVVEKGNKNALSDGAVAAMMTRTAVLSALLNVKINLGAIKDEEYVNRVSAEVKKLEDEVVEIEAQILSKVNL